MVICSGVLNINFSFPPWLSSFLRINGKLGNIFGNESAGNDTLKGSVMPSLSR